MASCFSHERSIFLRKAGQHMYSIIMLPFQLPWMEIVNVPLDSGI